MTGWRRMREILQGAYTFGVENLLLIEGRRHRCHPAKLARPRAKSAALQNGRTAAGLYACHEHACHWPRESCRHRAVCRAAQRTKHNKRAQPGARLRALMSGVGVGSTRSEQQVYCSSCKASCVWTCMYSMHSTEAYIDYWYYYTATWCGLAIRYPNEPDSERLSGLFALAAIAGWHFDL